MSRILLVDDEPNILALLQTRIEAVGHEAVLAANGQEALSEIEKQMPDLIITDVVMPVMDGFTFYKELKSHSLTKDIPVLVLTARGKMEDSFAVLGADEFIVKPFDAGELMTKIKVLLARDKSVFVDKPEIKALVAGSENEAVEGIAVILKKAGCEIQLVSRGPEVIAQAAVNIPQLIVLDVQMFDMETEEIIRVLRKMTDFEHLPILLYSYYRVSELGSEDICQKALNIDAAQEACLLAGATEYFGRFQKGSFLKKVKPYLE